MKRSLLFGTMAMLSVAFNAVAAEKDDVKSAANALAGKNNYSWKMTVENAGGGGGGQFRVGPTEGKAEKDGFTHLSMTRGDNTFEAVLKGDKGAVKTADGWKSLAEAGEGGGGGGGGQNPGRAIARMLRTFKAPAAQVADLADKTKELKKADDAYTGELTEDAARELMAFGGRGGGGGNAPTITNPKGTVKIWVKDGVLSKYEYNVQGTMSFNGNDRNINRTTTVEIKDVDNTKVEVPEEAKQKAA